jgi:hypothetical protein
MNTSKSKALEKRKLHVKDGGTSSQPRPAYDELYSGGSKKGKVFKRHFGTHVASTPGFNNYK